MLCQNPIIHVKTEKDLAQYQNFIHQVLRGESLGFTRTS